MKSFVVAVVVLMLLPAVAFADGSGTPAASPDRQACTKAMSDDPAFASDIVKRAATSKDLTKDALDALAAAGSELKTDVKIVDVHVAEDQAAMNKQHVLLAYGAMWFIAAVFVIFLWRRQLALKGEILVLRSELLRTIDADKK